MYKYTTTKKQREKEIIYKRTQKLRINQRYAGFECHPNLRL